MFEWRKATIESIAALTKSALATGPFGSTIGKKTFRSSGVPVIRGSNLTSDTGTRLIESDLVFVDPELAKKFQRSIARRGDLVFTCWGTTNQVGFIDDRATYDEYVVSNKQMKLTPDSEQAIPEFIYYFFSSPDGQAAIRKQSIGSSVPGFNLTGLKQICVPLPPLGEQALIVNLLSSLDDKIELNRRMIETLEAMTRAIFRDWFVDFGPIRAKVEGRAPYLGPEIWNLFPDALDDGDKPEGWSVAHLTSLAEVNPDSWSAKNTPEEVEYVDLANTKWGTIEATQRYNWKDAPSRAKRVLQPGDTIVGMVRPGNGSFAFVGESGLTGSTGFAVLRPRQPKYTELTYLAATSSENIERLANLADGAAYPAVRPEVVGATEIALTDDAVINAFSEVSAPILNRMESTKRENRALAETRDLLLPKLMSGEIRLREAERVAEAVA